MSKTIKIIHVHFISGHHNYYFGSVRAIYKMFSPEELGCSEIYLRHQLTQTGNHFLNDRVLIIRSTQKKKKKRFILSSRFLRHSQIFEQLFVLINTKEVFWNMQALKYR